MKSISILSGIGVCIVLTCAQPCGAQEYRLSDLEQIRPHLRIAKNLIVQDQDKSAEQAKPVESSPAEKALRPDETVDSLENSKAPNVVPVITPDDLGIAARMAQREFGKWPRKEIQEIKIDIRLPNSAQPRDQSAKLVESGTGDWAQFNPADKVFAWCSPGIRYQPLYFEDVALERYGQTYSPYRQSVASGVHFFKSLVFLPNQMRHNSPGSCDYPLGFCRPGVCLPSTFQHQYFGRPRNR